jgi:uncharacterized protein
MKKNNFLLKGIIAVTLFITALVAGSSYAQVDAKAKPSKVDIHTAVAKGDLDAVKQYIAAGSNLDETDPASGSSPLITAALFDRKEIAGMLLEAGAKINFRNNDGSTALHTAAFFCRPEIVRLLLEKGADKTIRNKYGSTAFEAVSAPFAEVKPIYDFMDQILEPMGIVLDYAYIEKTRPEIAALLK